MRILLLIGFLLVMTDVHADVDISKPVGPGPVKTSLTTDK